MQDSFDPYAEWLDIRGRGRPPDHYALLGLPRSQSDPKVIAEAADVRMARVRKIRPGKHLPDWGRLLDQLGAAKVCLLDPASKAAYDASLPAEGPAHPPAPQSSAPAGTHPAALAEPPAMGVPSPKHDEPQPPAPYPTRPHDPTGKDTPPPAPASPAVPIETTPFAWGAIASSTAARTSSTDAPVETPLDPAVTGQGQLPTPAQPEPVQPRSRNILAIAALVIATFGSVAALYYLLNRDQEPVASREKDEPTRRQASAQPAEEAPSKQTPPVESPDASVVPSGPEAQPPPPTAEAIH